MEDILQKMNQLIDNVPEPAKATPNENRAILRQLLLLRGDLETVLTDKVTFLIERYSELAALEEGQDAEDVVQQEMRSMTFTNALTANTSLFKGKHPKAVLLSEETIRVHTWRDVAVCILRACDAACPGKLENLCGKVYGMQRPLLTSTAEVLSAPVEIRKGVYFESRQDTEIMLKIIVQRILQPMGFDSRSIRIQYTAK